MPLKTLKRVVLRGARMCLKARTFRHELKDDGSILTEIDTAISGLMQRTLQGEGYFNTRGNLLLDEEGTPLHAHDVANCRQLVVIDPIDGTCPFATGRPEYTVMASTLVHAGDSRFTGRYAVAARPALGELTVFDGKQVLAGRLAWPHRLRPLAAPGQKPPYMLMDYHWEKTFSWHDDSTLIHCNPSGYNMLDLIYGKAVGFVFVYKPWDLCLLPMAEAVGIRQYALHRNADGTLRAKPLPPGLDLALFWNDEAQTYGKIKVPLLLTRPEHLAHIMNSLA